MKNKNKLLVLSIVGLSLICTSCNKGFDKNTKDKDNYEFKVTSKVDKIASASELSYMKGTNLSVSYFNNERVAFLELNDMVNFLNDLNIAVGQEYQSSNIPSFSVSQNDEVFTITNKKFDTTCVINFKNRTLVFGDYHSFTNTQPSEKASTIHAFGGKADGAKENFYKVTEDYLNGGVTTIDLSKYNIDMPYYENKGYLPFQTVADVFFSGVGIAMTIINNTIYTGGAIVDGENLTPYGKSYYDSIKGLDKLTTYESTYNYYETCLLLDNLYGLKVEHGISSFDQYFIEQGQKDKMISDSKEFDEALAKLLNVKISDFHTGFKFSSPWSGSFAPSSKFSLQGALYQTFCSTLVNIRTKALGENVEPIQIEGDTAFITFDAFVVPQSLNEVYKETDTFYTSALIKESLNKINNDSSIKNVVLDLSCNGGGMADAAIDVVNAFLGYCAITTRDKFTGSTMSALYMVDSNLDGVIDKNDTFRDGLNKYVLTSRSSFSCGNLVPALLKEGGCTIIGETTGGGSCIVYDTVTANGTMFQMSGSTEIVTYKNGRLVSVDDGVTPDYKITSFEKYYDRKSLSSWLDTLY